MKAILLFLLMPLCAAAPSRRVVSQVAAEPMARIPGGEFRPFLQPNDQPDIVKVHPFYLDVHAVTNEDYLAFVKANPQWVRSKVSRLYADRDYLRNWAGDFNVGDARILHSPVTYVSWFAAEAYAKWLGKRLPTMVEWEYAAAALPLGMKGVRMSDVILKWYDHPAPKVLPPVESTYKNIFGIYDMHGLVWEWVDDFNSVSTGNGAFTCAATSLDVRNKEDYAAFMRYAFRESLKATYTVGCLGFRCAMDSPGRDANHF